MEPPGVGGGAHLATSRQVPKSFTLLGNLWEAGFLETMLQKGLPGCQDEWPGICCPCRLAQTPSLFPPLLDFSPVGRSLPDLFFLTFSSFKVHLNVTDQLLCRHEAGFHHPPHPGLLQKQQDGAESQ
jgi:hypothetical protein